MDAGMAGLAERQEIVEVTGARGVVPDRVDVVGVEPPALSADHAPIPGAGVNARGLLTRPAADVGPFRRHSPLPEVRPLSAPRCPDDAEVLLRVHARPLERPSLTPLHQPGESALFPTVELEPVPRQVLPHGMVGDARVLCDGGDVEASQALPRTNRQGCFGEMGLIVLASSAPERIRLRRSSSLRSTSLESSGTV